MPDYVSVKEWAYRFDVSPKLARKLVAQGRLEGVKVGRLLRVKRDAQPIQEPRSAS